MTNYHWPMTKRTAGTTGWKPATSKKKMIRSSKHPERVQHVHTSLCQPFRLLREAGAGLCRKGVALSWDVKAFHAYLPEYGIRNRFEHILTFTSPCLVRLSALCKTWSWNPLQGTCFQHRGYHTWGVESFHQHWRHSQISPDPRR